MPSELREQQQYLGEQMIWEKKPWQDHRSGVCASGSPEAWAEQVVGEAFATQIPSYLRLNKNKGNCK